MKKTMKYITYLCAALLAVALYSCADDNLEPKPADKDGTLLNLYIGDIAQPATRLAELDRDQISQNHLGKQDISLYIYYQDDYDKDDLTKPYVRNLKCTVGSDGKIAPANPSEGSGIYIYDRMTIVAFYPYNAAANDYTFKTKNDEKKYPITEGNYSNQFYIPYRAEANVNPTNAFFVNLVLYPVQTTKIQVVLTTSHLDLFPGATTQTDGVVKLVTSIDPKDATSGDKRENWVDVIEQNYGSAPDPATSGQYVQRFSAYIWRNDDANDPHHGSNKNHNDNTIKKGEVLLQSDKLTLFFPEDVAIHEGRVYRYGYNIDTGELFIPTSDNLIYDAATLKAAGGGGYQVTDIDLKDVANWTPVNLSGTYDGGGHKVKGLKIEQSGLTGDQNIGLFGSASGNSLIKNLELESPVINIDFSAAGANDVLKVGALVGQLNKALTDKEIKNLLAAELAYYNGLGLPQSVIDALVADRVKEFTGGVSAIEGSKVSSPAITVKGNNVIVGGLAGEVGDDAIYKGAVKDSYVSGGTISVNATEADKALYTNVQAGAFAGLLASGLITDSYTTATAVAYVKDGTVVPAASKEVAKGFANVAAPAPGTTTTITDSYTKARKNGDDANVKQFDVQWPAWTSYSGEWPVANSSLTTYWGSVGSSPSTYPALIWETRLDVDVKK
ncbi:hypothetical protein [Limibacterium fermenti]|uniref:hypothetical protein n=1 Tax=Limibacterium fermenti TaxID=3229863 RepID=UPI003A61C27C